jgi:hypothetical protein
VEVADESPIGAANTAHPSALSVVELGNRIDDVSM